MLTCNLFPFLYLHQEMSGKTYKIQKNSKLCATLQEGFGSKAFFNYYKLVNISIITHGHSRWVRCLPKYKTNYLREISENYTGFVDNP